MFRMKLPKVYEPELYETDIYALWEKSESFKPSGKGKPYSIVIPPPNANGNLHLGHGLTMAIEDILIRYHRQKGDNVLFVPGADHAGFETWVVYEKMLNKQGKSRFDFSREDLYQQIWDFVADNKENYEGQFRKLGASVDWSHYVYTLDKKIVDQAYSTFEKMFKQGLIYRAEKLVNFCTYHGTGFADIEVAHKEEKGHLWHIRYPLVDGSGELIVATTRPETMLGDTAVAVNPKDERYKNLVGKTVKLPLTEREIPIIADDFVDTEFGTGAVKITPAHDPNDYEAGKRHDLPFMTVINHEGKLTGVPDKYLGLTVEEGRDAVVKDLEAQQQIVKIEEHMHSVGHCYKCDTVIQPLMREQWFIDMKPLVKKAVSALESNQLEFYPANKKTQLIAYLQNLRDWNISRQIAWGIPIPAFQNIDQSDDWIFDDRVTEEFIKISDKTYRRDPDVFDTWFSSSSWPYATIDYPDGEDFQTFYPLSVMETGADILYPWVSRMLMFGLYETDEIPFRDVYLHGMIQDEHGQKMSKSKGNVVNPMEKIDAFGSDAFRMGIISDETPGGNRPYDESKIVGARNFCNKLWNISRFIEDILGEDVSRGDVKPITAADHWILNKLEQTQQKISKDLDGYRIADAYSTLYHFVWDDLADWYIESSKAEPNKPVLAHLLENVLLLAHPFAPFLTETIWQTLAWENDSILATRILKKPISSDKNKAADFAEIQKIVTEIRYISNALKVAGLTLYYKEADFIKDNSDIIKTLARLKDVAQVTAGNGLYLTSTKHSCWLDIDQSTASQYLVELDAKLEQQHTVIKQLEGRLSNKNYVKNAPSKIVDQTKQQLSDAKELIATIETEKKRFSN